MPLTAEQHFNRAKKYVAYAEEHDLNGHTETAALAAAIALAHATIAHADAAAQTAHFTKVAAEK